jgi:thioredoxin 2
MSTTYAACEKCGRLNRAKIESAKEPICGACQTKLSIRNAVVAMSERTFQTVVEKSPIPVIVDFWAPWCKPCADFAPTFEFVAKGALGKMVFAKINCDDAKELPERLGIRGIPTIVAFHHGKELGRQAGALHADNFRQWLRGVEISTADDAS